MLGGRCSIWPRPCHWDRGAHPSRVQLSGVHAGPTFRDEASEIRRRDFRDDSHSHRSPSPVFSPTALVLGADAEHHTRGRVCSPSRSLLSALVWLPATATPRFLARKARTKQACPPGRGAGAFPSSRSGKGKEASSSQRHWERGKWTTTILNAPRLALHRSNNAPRAPAISPAQLGWQLWQLYKRCLQPRRPWKDRSPDA